jgi:hypothetical protein
MEVRGALPCGACAWAGLMSSVTSLRGHCDVPAVQDVERVVARPRDPTLARDRVGVADWVVGGWMTLWAAIGRWVDGWMDDSDEG